MLGDVISAALSKVGITEERVERFLGYPCGCRARRERLNQLARWAWRVNDGKIEQAEEYLEAIISGGEGSHQRGKPCNG